MFHLEQNAMFYFDFVYIINSFIFIFDRELLLNNNLLRVLPNEIGKLFHIHILGLHGNPLQKDLQSIYNEPNGTQKLLTYLLDNLSCKFLSYVLQRVFLVCMKFDNLELKLQFE